MSRYYHVDIETRTKAPIGLLNAKIEDLGWNLRSKTSTYSDGITYVWVDGSLCGGMNEWEAHDEIAKAIKELDSLAKVRTRFTYMEDLPYDEYGDDLSEEGVLIR